MTGFGPGSGVPQNRSICCRKRASTTADVQKMTQAEDTNLQFFVFHRTSDYRRHEPFARVFNLAAPAVLSSRVFAIRTAPADIRTQCRSRRHQGRKAGFCLRDRKTAHWPIADGHGRVVGNLALASGRADTQLRDRHDDAETNCAPSYTTACPWCSSPMHGRLGSANCRRTCRSSRRCWPPKMICWPVSARVGNVKNNDPSLTEPIAGIV